MCRASDPDAGINGRVSYSLSARSAADYGHLFSVDSRTGVVSQRVPVDYEAHRDPITLHVIADDGGEDSLSATARVVVTVRDVNDHTPDIRFETTGTGSDVTASENDVGESRGEITGSGSDVVPLRVVEHGPADEFLAHMSVQDSDSGDAGRIHCTMPSSHFSLVRMYPNEYKVSSTPLLEHFLARDAFVRTNLRAITITCCCNLCFYFLGHLLVQLVLPLCPVDTFVLLLCHIH